MRAYAFFVVCKAEHIKRIDKYMIFAVNFIRMHARYKRAYVFIVSCNRVVLSCLQYTFAVKTSKNGKFAVLMIPDRPKKYNYYLFSSFLPELSFCMQESKRLFLSGCVIAP